MAELGSGWGAFAIYIAATTGARVTAINVSPEQLRIARENAVAAGVDSLVEFRELDYRALEGRFDRVVSVGMMEHVGLAQFDAYFGKIRSLLADDGFAFVHCIGRMRPPGSTGPFIRKYIFPGAYVPSLSEVFAATERAGLWVADMEVLRLHYHYTLQHWRRRFVAAHRSSDLADVTWETAPCRGSRGEMAARQAASDGQSTPRICDGEATETLCVIACRALCASAMRLNLGATGKRLMPHHL